MTRTGSNAQPGTSSHRHAGVRRGDAGQPEGVPVPEDG